MHGRPELLVQVHLAGYAAEGILAGKRSKDAERRIGLACISVGHSIPELSEGHEGTDEHRAIGELVKMGIAIESETLRLEIDRYLGIAKESLVAVWPSVTAVAKALVKHGEIDREEFLVVPENLSAPVPEILSGPERRNQNDADGRSLSDGFDVSTRDVVPDAIER